MAFFIMVEYSPARDPLGATGLLSRGRRLTKCHVRHPDGTVVTEGYDHAKSFSAAELTLDTLPPIEKVLRLPSSTHTIIRAQPRFKAHDVSASLDLTDPEACARHLVAGLPVHFMMAGYAAQFSGSHLVGPKRRNQIRMHIWFLLSRPLARLDLDAVAHGLFGHEIELLVRLA